MPTLGGLVRSLRKSRGWIQAELAKRSGLSLFTISTLEQGKCNYERGTLQKLATAFGFADPEELFSQLQPVPSPEITRAITDGDALCSICDHDVAVGTISESVITGCNARLGAMLGYEPKELIGQSSAMIVEKRFVGQLARRFAADLPFVQDLPLRRKNGEIVTIHWTCYPVITALGKVTWLGITRR